MEGIIRNFRSFFHFSVPVFCSTFSDFIQRPGLCPAFCLPLDLNGGAVAPPPLKTALAFDRLHLRCRQTRLYFYLHLNHRSLNHRNRQSQDPSHQSGHVPSYTLRSTVSPDCWSSTEGAVYYLFSTLVVDKIILAEPIALESGYWRPLYMAPSRPLST